MLAKSVLILSTLTQAPVAHHEHMIDASQIMAVQRLARLFPNVNFVTEIRYRFNVRFMRFTPVENTIMRNQRELVSDKKDNSISLSLSLSLSLMLISFLF